jgi:hypothetical protein
MVFEVENLVFEVELDAERMSTAEMVEEAAYSLAETWVFWRVVVVSFV